MPELRKDPVIGRWVIISTERARRPGNFVDRADVKPENGSVGCHFCDDEVKVIYKTAEGLPNVRVVEYQGTLLKSDEEFKQSKRGLYTVAGGIGKHEVVVESPEHIANMADLSIAQIEQVLKAYALRIRQLQKSSSYRVVLVYKNYGESAGSRNISHARSHIFASAVVPLRVKEKLLGAEQYYKDHQRCIYCDLMSQEISSGKRIIFENEHFAVLTPFAARFLFETLIIPKKHCHTFDLGIEGCEAALAEVLSILLKKFKHDLDDPAYNYVIQTAPINLDSNEGGAIDKSFHWHMELVPRLTRLAGFEKGTGFYIN